MRSRTIVLVPVLAALTGLLVFCFSQVSGADEPTGATSLRIQKLLSAAERANYGLTASQIQENIANTQVSIQEGAYLPHLDFDVIDSPGFPGSSGTMGVYGIMGSPFRAGVSSGLTAYGTLWDFGRTMAKVRTAKEDAKGQQALTEVRRGDVDEVALGLYFECVRYRSLMQSWEFIAAQATIVDREVRRFVSTGQRSIVDKYLSRSQLEQATTEEDDSENEMKLSEERLRILTKLASSEVSCPDVDSMNDSSAGVLSSFQENPLITHQTQEVRSSEARTDQARADFMPEIKGFASVGMMESAHIIDKQDWGAGLALSFPIFEGFQTENGLHASEAESERQQELLDETRYEIDQENARYDQQIESSKARLDDLKSDYQIASKGFQVARTRYLTMRGSLVDLREALRNLSSIRVELIDTATSYWLSRIEKAVFDGERIKS